MMLILIALLFQQLAGPDPAQMEQAPDLGYVPVPHGLKLPDGVTLGAPSSVATTAGGHLLVFNRGKWPLIEFDGSGHFVRSLGEGRYMRPHGMRVDAEGNIWTTDVRSHTVTKMSPKGDVLLELGSTVVNEPNDLAIAPNGDIFVVQGHGGNGSQPRVLRFDKAGKLLKTWGRQGSGPGEFDIPHSIVIDAKRTVYVADRQNRRVQIFDVDGNFVKQWKFAGLPCGLYLDRNQQMYLVTGYAGQILKLDANGRAVAATGQPGKALGEFGEAHYLTVTASGDIYVADTVGSQLHKFVRRAPTGSAAASQRGAAQASKELKIYTIDVEGGGATLFVAPSGESLLVDTGNGDAAAARDAGRIMAAVKDAGITQIDHLVITHYHGDHVGGVSELASRIPIKHYIDHGPTVEPKGSGLKYVERYNELAAAARHTVVKPGDTIPIAGLDVRVATSAGQVIGKPLAGAGQANPSCANVKRVDPDLGENAQSVGISLVFGRFRVAHLGDLTWNGELDLMCPNNKFGTADLFIVSHHAQQSPTAMSNSAALVHALRPRVAISSNGLRKGAQPAAMRVLFTSPGLEDLWQLHFSQFSGQEYTVPGTFIANWSDAGEKEIPLAPFVAPPQGQQAPPAPTHNGPAHYFKVTAQQDGTFTVTNTRTDFSKTYVR